ncbi:MAG: MBL fold metallo-hydrolase [Bacteroidetes bacterium]|nr:MAG: MBL fold metallo-hydrolase [Bacteroidota bacterium]
MVFSVTILGSNSAIPTLKRNPSAHLLNVNERIFLLDCAEGTQLQLRRYRIHFQRIRHIMISHLHGDHYYGLIGFLTTLHLLGRKDELHIYAPAGLEEIIQMQLNVSSTTLIYPVIFHPLVSAALQPLFEDERVMVHSFPLLHSVPTFGFLFREKIKVRKNPALRAYAYCTDTAYDEQIIPWISGVDLLYHEATFMQDMAAAAAEKMHSTAREAAMIAKKSRVKKLLIGHFSARYDDLTPLLHESRELFPETFLAEDGITINV